MGSETIGAVPGSSLQNVHLIYYIIYLVRLKQRDSDQKEKQLMPRMTFELPMNPNNRSVVWLVGRSVTLPCSYRGTCPEFRERFRGYGPKEKM